MPFRKLIKRRLRSVFVSEFPSLSTSVGSIWDVSGQNVIDKSIDTKGLYWNLSMNNDWRQVGEDLNNSFIEFGKELDKNTKKKILLQYLELLHKSNMNKDQLSLWPNSHDMVVRPITK